MINRRFARPALLWASLALLTTACPGNARAALKDGTPAPTFTAQAALAGHEFTFSLADALTHGPVVLYFYPQAFTQGCTVEAHDFAEAMPQFKALGASVIGVSGDSIDTLKKFSVSECQSKFPVAADGDRAVMKAYDSVLIPFTAYADRTSYVITPDGKVLYSFTSLDPDQHVANTTRALTQWRQAHPASG
jgi:peroxiredoxin